MKTSLKNFLTELYDIDPTLKSHEVELIPLVEKLLSSDPAQEPDTEFVKRLRMQLQNRVAELTAQPSVGFSKWIYAFGGALTAAIILPVGFVAVNSSKSLIPGTNKDAYPLATYTITDDGKNAFGPLSGVSPETTMTRNQSGGGGMGGGGGVTTAPAMGSDAKMIAPYPMTQYEYVYDGALPDLTPSVAVYKRNPISKSLAFSSLGSILKIGDIDLSSFADMNVDSVSFSQNKPYGYQLTVNLRDTSVYLDAQWDQWPQSKCQTDACFQAERVKLTDVPPEAQLIAAAHAFIKDHEIDISHYGTPEVDMQWKRDYERAIDTTQAWIPDQIRVIYPLMIDGHKVSDQSGAPFGISVGVHVKTQKVMNVYGIMSRHYSKSEYAGVSDPQKIKDYLAKLDSYAWMPVAEQKEAKTATVTLGEPTMGYSVYYTYKDNVNQELLIPALTFPVKDVKGGDQYFYRSSVVVPLASDMLQEQMNGGQPMPLDGVRAM